MTQATMTRWQGLCTGTVNNADGSVEVSFRVSDAANPSANTEDPGAIARLILPANLARQIHYHAGQTYPLPG